MEAVPWTVTTFKQRRRDTWKAIRLWLLLLFIALAGFSVPFYTESTKVKIDRTATRVRYRLSLDDMTGAELIISLVSFISAGTGTVGIVWGVKRHYRCPKCEAMPMGSWSIFRLNLFIRRSGVEVFPAVCPSCGARLS